MNVGNAVKRLGTALLIAGAAVSPAFAAGPASPDLSALTPDFGTVTTSLVAIGGAVAIVYVAWKGIKMGLRGIKGF